MDKPRKLIISKEKQIGSRSNIIIPIQSSENKNTIQVPFSESSPTFENLIQTKALNPKSIKNEDFNPRYINLHSNEGFIVCGCGASLKSVTDLSEFITIGVNDVSRIMKPNYLLVVNAASSFHPDRWKYVQYHRSEKMLTHLDNPQVDPAKVVKIKLGKKGVFDSADKTKIDYSNNSPYMAVIAAYQMGARKIGLIGVDFTDHHFFADSGTHILTKNLESIIRDYNRLAVELTQAGVTVANLSAESKMTSWPKMTLEEFRKI